MADLISLAATLGDLALVVVGFSFIIFVHELGHFLAARWAGVRVLAFAIGFGPAIVTYRKGLGLRRGSSEGAYRAWLADRGLTRHDPPPAGVSPCEYRLNWLPFGGYVKMLGQEDANPGATSAAADSYQNCHPARRLVVISAGVVANVVLAAAAFMLVFLVGLRTEPPRVGDVVPGGPAAQALPVEAPQAGPGLRTGDEIIRLDGRRARTFNDLVLASAMASPGEPVRVRVAREGAPGPLDFRILPEASPMTGLLELGVLPPQSTRVVRQDSPEVRDFLERVGLQGVRPGMELAWTRVGQGERSPAADAADLADAFRGSEGRTVTLGFVPGAGDSEAAGEARATGRADAGGEVAVAIEPRPQFQEGMVALGESGETVQTHLLGLTPVMTVERADPGGPAHEQGLRTGDVFARLGSVEFPSIAQGIAEIRAHAGSDIGVVLLRPDGTGDREEVRLLARVSGDGRIGFVPGQLLDDTLLSLPPAEIRPARADGRPSAPPAAAVIDRPGLRVLEAGGRAVTGFAALRAALLEATRDAHEAGQGAQVELLVELPLKAGPTDRRVLELDAAAVASLHGLGYQPPTGLLAAFEPARFTLRADGPVDAVRVGLAETHRVMLMTYVTFVRLFQGSVRVEHLKGPVGIAHLGTRIADRGLVWLVFFMALISVNLAVVNFLPLPIVDGGQFLFILAEWVRGRPVPEAIQSVAALAGMVLIGLAFVVVTFNDIRGVIGGM